MKIAILGVGAMGSRMAMNHLKVGHQVVVYNRNPEKAKPLVEAGAILAHSPREAASQTEIIISIVTDETAAQTIWLEPNHGAVHGLQAGAIAIESSTITPTWIKQLEPHIKKQNANLLDAPVVGSRPQAEAGQLIFLVGGDSQILEQARPALECIGGAIHHVGTLGQGSSLKLMVNALFGIQVAAISELLGAGQHLGLDENRVIAILNDLPVTSPALKGTMGLIQARNFSPMFPIALVKKDFAYLLKTASSKTPVTQAVHQVLEQAMTAGLQEENINSMAKLFLK